jgi:hypothetical protein
MDVFSLGANRVDLGCLAVHRANGTVSLTPIESELIRRLVRAAGEPVARDVLLQDVWGYSASVRSRTVDTTVHRLRGKLEVDPKRPEHLVTVRGRGVALEGVRPVDAPAHVPSGSDLIGRDELVEAVVGRVAEGASVALVGPVGSGRSAVVRAVAARFPGAVVLDLEDAREAVDVYRRVVGRAPTQLAATPEDVGRYLAHAAPPLLVLDGLDPAVLPASVVKDWSTRVPVVATDLLAGTGLQVVPVEPLALDDARALLERELTRLGHAVPAEQVETLLARVDRLPRELVLLAPLVGLFGDAAVDGLGEAFQEPLQRAVQLLDPERRELLFALTRFRGAFDLEAALAVTAAPRLELMGALQLFRQRGLLFAHGSTFRLLRAMRVWGDERRRPPGSEDRWLAWCANLRNASLTTGAEVLERHREDLLEAAEELLRREVDGNDELAESVALALSDLASLSGDNVRLLRALAALADHTRSDRIQLLAIAVRLHGGHVPTDEQRAFLHEMSPRSMLATYLAGHGHRLTAQRAFDCSVEERARMTAHISRLGLGELEQVLGPLASEARRQGWTLVEQLVPVTWAFAHIYVGDHAAALRWLPDRRDLVPYVAVQASLARGIAQLGLGRTSEARRTFEGVLTTLVTARLRFLVLLALIDVHEGEEPQLDEVFGPLTPPLERAVAQAALALHTGRPFSGEGPVAEVMATGRAPGPDSGLVLLTALAVVVRHRQETP